VAVFSDERVIEKLKEFIPVAADCRHTQGRLNWNEERWEKDELAQYFRKIIQKNKVLKRRGFTTFSFADVTRTGTAQGHYVFDAEGESFGGHNYQTADQVLRLLEDAKRKYDAKTKTKLALGAPSDAQKQPPPVGAAIFRSFSRIDPVPPGASSRNAFVGRDYMWLLQEEAEALARGEFPDSLKGRLVRLQLFDNVRGSPHRWDPEQVKLADFRAVSKTNRAGTLTKIVFEGEFRMVAPYGRGRAQEGFPLPETGYEGRLEGEILYSPQDGVRDGMIYVEGMHWGRSTYNPEAPDGKYPLKFAFVFAPDNAARTVDPWGTNCGMDDYLNPRLH